MVLLKQMIKSTQYTLASTLDILIQLSDSSLLEKTQAAHKIIQNELFEPEFTKSCLEVLVSKYMVLHREDFIAWEADPEFWYSEDESDQWEFQMRVIYLLTLGC